MSIRQMLARTNAEETLRACESALIDPDVRRSEPSLRDLLHEDFTEIGSSGNVYDREAMIEMMLTEAHGEVIIRDFSATFLSDTVALVTYRSIGSTGQEARRSSIWMHSDERWQLRHHQGSRVFDRWGRVS